MREIKFRLYFREGKKLTYSTHTFEVTDKRLHIMLARFDENTIVGFVQFTGLLDKNGKEIFEGDVIQTIGSENTKIKHEIIFEDGGFCAKNLVYKNTGKLSQKWITELDFEVICNKFQTPKP